MHGHAFERPRSSATHVRALVAGRREADCFADEVVVDFPSLARAVERIRRPFLEQAAAVSADLRLSPREAAAGAVVPLDAPVRCLCRDCGGRGESWTERCVRCGGTGAELRRHRVRVALPARVADGDCFHFTVAPRHQPPTRVELRVVID